MSTPDWSGPKVMAVRAKMQLQLPTPCGMCGEMVKTTDQWVVGHKVPRWERPELTWVSENWQHEHRKCSDASGQHEVKRKAFAAGVKAAASGDFSRPPASSQPPLVSISLSGVHDEPEREPTNWLEIVAQIPWLEEFRDIPEDATPPRYITGPHPRAVGTYGPQFLAWADANNDVHAKRSDGLRYWQRMVATRILEHDEDGVLVWRNVIITLARQCGKSWLLRALVMWRIQQRELFGDEEQTVISVAHKMSTAQEVFRPAVRWGMGRKDLDWHVRAANGSECITSPEGGRWMLGAATDGLGVGFSLSMIICDEGWKVPRATIEGADPALTEAHSPQLMLVSTAGDSTSDLFMVYRSRALDDLDEPDNTFIVEWSAPKSLALEDENGWKMASPIWTAKREKEVRDKLFKLDPLEFEQNYLNRWVEFAHGRKDSGEVVVSAVEWEDLEVETPTDTPVLAAVESWFSEGVSVTFAYRQGESIVVSVKDCQSAAEAALACLSSGTPLVLVGKSLALDPAFASLSVETRQGTTRLAVQELRRLIDEGAVLHDGSPELTRQVLDLRASKGADGPRVRSTGRCDAVKSVYWAVSEARISYAGPLAW